MDRSKIFVVVGIVLVLIVAVSIVGAIAGDDENVKLTFQEALTAERTVVELSQLATAQASRADLANRAATIVSTNGSDLVALSTYYKSYYGEAPSETAAPVVEDLRSNSENFDARYQEAVTEYLQIAQDRLRTLQGTFGDARFQTIVDTALANIEDHLVDITAFAWPLDAPRIVHAG